MDIASELLKIASVLDQGSDDPEYGFKLTKAIGKKHPRLTTPKGDWSWDTDTHTFALAWNSDDEEFNVYASPLWEGGKGVEIEFSDWVTGELKQFHIDVDFTGDLDKDVDIYMAKVKPVLEDAYDWIKQYRHQPGEDVITEDEFDHLTADEKSEWKGYTVSITYETWDEEALEAGETNDRGYEMENADYNYLDEILGDSPVKFKSWLEWSSSHPTGAHDWIVSQEDEDFRSGDRTTYNLFIKRKDGKPLSQKALAHIKKELRLH